MKIHYYPDTDSIAIHLKDSGEGIVGENMVLHRDAGTLYEIGL